MHLTIVSQKGLEVLHLDFHPPLDLLSSTSLIAQVWRGGIMSLLAMREAHFFLIWLSSWLFYSDLVHCSCGLLFENLGALRLLLLSPQYLSIMISLWVLDALWWFMRVPDGFLGHTRIGVMSSTWILKPHWSGSILRQRKVRNDSFFSSVI